MADSSTTKLSLTLPEVDVSTTWATSINNNFTTLDDSVLLTNTQTLENKTLTDCDATTQATGNNSTKIATTAFVKAELALQDALSELLDVDVSSVADNDILAYDSSSSKFINQSSSEAGLQPTIADGDLTIAKTNGLQSALDAKLDSSAHTKASLDVDHLITLSGVSDASDDLGTFAGSTIADSETVKGALQDLETAVETKLNSSDHTKASLDVDHLITLSGVADASDDLGTFTGSTIADSSTIKASLQSLETAVETKQDTISSSARINADLIHDGSISNTEFGHLNGVTSNIQTQINSISGVSEDTVVALSIALG